MNTQEKFRWLALFLLGTLMMYGRSLPYPFVYDDHWRVETNPAITDLSNVARYFTDPATQSSNPGLHHDNYRPLVTLSFAFDHAIWNLRPFGYRLTNILLHAVNAWLLMMLSLSAFGLSVPAAAIAGLIFLVHPMQIESVAWISERTNPLGLFFILCGLLSWGRFLTERKPKWGFLAQAALVASMLSRESGVCLAFGFILLDLFRKRKPGAYEMMSFILIGLYFPFRHLMLGQIKMSGYWGGSWITNLANAFAVWPLTVQKIIWPTRPCATYSDLPVATSWFDGRVGLGLLLMGMVLSLAWTLRKKSPRTALCLLFIVLFWLPGSNIIPLTTLFAERLLYPMLAWTGIMVGIAWDEVRLKKIRPVLGGLLLALTLLTVTFLPIWRNEESLWRNATQVRPNNWFAWACLAQEQLRKGDLPGAEESLLTSLHQQVPADQAADLFMELSKLNRRLGQTDLAKRHAARARELKPNGIW